MPRKATGTGVGFPMESGWLLGALGVAALVCYAYVADLSRHFIPGQGHAERPILGQLFLGFGWGMVQQYVLQSFINRRAQVIRGPGWFSILLVAVVFAGLHLPNPWLTVITFAGGVVWATVYQRAPNIFALAVSHSVMTWVLVSTLPASALNHLRIGFKYFG